MILRMRMIRIYFYDSSELSTGRFMFRIPVSVLWRASGVLATLAASAAFAHSPYLLPNFFDVMQRDHVSVQASFAEDFFVPDVVMKADDFHVVMPDGRREPLIPVYTRDVAVLDVGTTAPGTYRISSGIREGRVSKATVQDGQWQFFEGSEAPPAGARVYAIRSITTADAYVSRGSPTDAVLAPRGKGLEFQMLTHPNRLLGGGNARLRVLFEGRPLAGQQVSLQRAANDYGRTPPALEILSDGNGELVLPLAEPGLYHAMTRHRFALPGAEAKAESHTYAVTLEVTE